MSEEFTFDMLHTRKPKRGTCMRCFSKPTEGILLIQAFDISAQASGALVSLTTTMCLECIEIMFRSIAVMLTPAVTFGKQCPGCQKEKTINGRISLIAKQYKDAKTQPNGSRASSTIANSSYNYCESCTVRMYRAACSLRDSSLSEGVPVTQEIES